jgi:hypothetical protein
MQRHAERRLDRGTLAQTSHKSMWQGRRGLKRELARCIKDARTDRKHQVVSGVSYAGRGISSSPPNPTAPKEGK